jgi:hypothetical protein
MAFTLGLNLSRRLYSLCTHVLCSGLLVVPSLLSLALRLPAKAQGMHDAVFPDTAISDFNLTGPAQSAPYMDTIAGRATADLMGPDEIIGQ